MSADKDRSSLLRYDGNSSGVIAQISSETVSIPAGAAGTVQEFQLSQFPIRDANGGGLTGDGDSSLSLTSTAFTNEVPFGREDADLNNGDFWVNPITGQGRGKKADTSTSMTASYTVLLANNSSQGVDAHDAAPTGNPLLQASVGYDVGSFPTQVTTNGRTVRNIASRYGEQYVYEARQRPGERPDDDVRKTEQDGNYSYVAAAGADNVIKASAGFLYGIIIGKDVASSVIEVSDSATDGDGNVKIYLEGSTLMTSTGGYVPVNAAFTNGITADLTNQTNVTFIYR